MIQFTEKDNSLIFTVKVVPRASKSALAGELDGALKIRLAAPPVEGAANTELIKLLSKAFSVSKSDIKILSGETSKKKQVEIFNTNGEKLKGLV